VIQNISWRRRIVPGPSSKGSERARKLAPRVIVESYIFHPNLRSRDFEQSPGYFFGNVANALRCQSDYPVLGGRQLVCASVTAIFPSRSILRNRRHQTW
jgi:hypothetical protein